MLLDQLTAVVSNFGSGMGAGMFSDLCSYFSNYILFITKRNNGLNGQSKPHLAINLHDRVHINICIITNNHCALFE